MSEISRQLTSEEVSKLKAAIPNTFEYFTNVTSLALLWGWFMLIAIYCALWAVLAWLGKLHFNADFGWGSHWSSVIFSIGVLLGGLPVLYEVFRQVRLRSHFGSAIRRDIASGVVSETRLKIVDVKRFQEPEHNGLLYFLLTSNHQVFTMFDDESQNFGVQGLDPLNSSFRPCEELVIVIAPESKLVLSSSFSGGGLELAPPLALTVPPDKWPESEAFCNIPWKELEQKLSRPARGSRYKKVSAK